MKAKEFDKKFDEDQEDIVDDLDLSSARRVNQEQKRINVDFPAWVVESLDREAARIGVTRPVFFKIVGTVFPFKLRLFPQPIFPDSASLALPDHSS